MEKSYGKRYGGQSWKSPAKSMGGGEKRQALWRKYCGNSYSEKHRWIRDAGRDGRCGWEIGWEKWKERYAGQIGELACEKHQWRRGTRRGTCDRAVGNIGGGEAREALWRKNRGNKKSWKELAKSICGEEVREETDAAVRKYVKKSGRSAMEETSWK